MFGLCFTKRLGGFIFIYPFHLLFIIISISIIIYSLFITRMDVYFGYWSDLMAFLRKFIIFIESQSQSFKMLTFYYFKHYYFFIIRLELENGQTWALNINPHSFCLYKFNDDKGRDKKKKQTFFTPHPSSIWFNKNNNNM